MRDAVKEADGIYVWRVEGMDCGSCVAKVEKAVGRLPGVGTIDVNLMAERMTVRARNGFEPARVEDQIAALGYTPTRIATAPAAPQHIHGPGCSIVAEPRCGSACTPRRQSGPQPWWAQTRGRREPSCALPSG